MSEEIKVTIVVGGRWSAFDLAKGLHNRGALHRLITNYPRFLVRRWGIPDEKIVCLTASQWVYQIVHRVSRSRLDVRFQHIVHRLFAAAAARCLGGSQIVHAWSGFAEPSSKLCRKRNIPIVVDRMSSHMRTQCRLLDEETKRLGLRRAITHPSVVDMELREYETATKVVVPSRFVEKSFLQNGFGSEKLIYNPLGVDLSRFSPASGDAIKDATFRIIYTGSLTYRKGIHYLLDAFRLAAISGARLTLVGGTSSESDRLIGEPPDGLERVAHVPQSELVRHYRSASVFVLASIEEGMAMVQAQALACGLPLICTENTGGEDLLQIIAPSVEPVHEEGGVRRYPAGFVVPIRDPASIARCLLRLHHDPQLLLSQSQAALRIHQASLDWQAYSDRAITQYRQIIQTTPQHV